MPKLHADKQLHYANSQRKPTKGSNLLHWFAVMIKTMANHQLSIKEAQSIHAHCLSVANK